MTTHDNTAQLANVTPVNHWVLWFKPILKAFKAEHGSRPTDAMLTAAVALTNKHRQPGVECLYVAMCMRPEGCQNWQYTSVSQAGLKRIVGTANNKRMSLVKAKILSETVAPGSKPWAYQLTITAAGKRELDATLGAVANATAAPAKAAVKAKAKPAVKAKAKKAKAQPVAITPEANVTPEPIAQATPEVATPDAVAALAAHFNG